MGFAGDKLVLGVLDKHHVLPTRTFFDAAMLVIALSISLGTIWGSIVSLTVMGLIEERSMTAWLAISAPLVTMMQYAAPIPVVLDASQTMSAANLSKVSFQLQAGCNILAMSYGIQVSNPTVLVSNMFGLGCQIVYLAVELHIRSPGTSWLSFFVEMAAMLNSSLFLFAAYTPVHVLGNGITVLNIALCAVPLFKLGGILRTRVNTMPTAMILVAVANNGLWTLYGFLLKDNVLLLPSLIGYLLSVFQVLVIMWCKAKLPFDLIFLQPFFRDHRQKESHEKVCDIELNVPAELPTASAAEE